jgi:hypothetical protein
MQRKSGIRGISALSLALKIIGFNNANECLLRWLQTDADTTTIRVPDTSVSPSSTEATSEMRSYWPMAHVPTISWQKPFHKLLEQQAN